MALHGSGYLCVVTRKIKSLLLLLAILKKGLVCRIFILLSTEQTDCKITHTPFGLTKQGKRFLSLLTYTKTNLSVTIAQGRIHFKTKASYSDSIILLLDRCSVNKSFSVPTLEGQVKWNENNRESQTKSKKLKKLGILPRVWQKSVKLDLWHETNMVTRQASSNRLSYVLMVQRPLHRSSITFSCMSQ